MVTPIELWIRGRDGDRRAQIVFWIRILATAVWLIFGTVFKIMNLVPRHREIIATILGSDIAPVIAVFIGLAETALGVWFLIGIFPRSCALLQTLAVVSMNTLELTYARSLLLAPVPMIILNSVFLALVWYAALYSSLRNSDGSAKKL